MGDHIPNAPYDDQREPMFDKNGVQLHINDTVTFNGGRGRIVEYLRDTGKYGASVRLITTQGQRVDIALLLDGAELYNPLKADEEDPSTPSYGM